MFTALFSFLGGGVARMIFGELMAWLNKKQDHEQEMARAAQQESFAAAQHARNLEAIKVQADMQVEVIHVQGEADIGKLETEGWLEAVKATGVKTGLWFVDAWNAVIRPAVATWAIVMMTLGEFGVIVLSENSIALCSASLGIYLASRDLFKRGK